MPFIFTLAKNRLMKSLFIPLLCLLSFSSFCQEPDLKDFSFKGCNTIVLKAKDSTNLFNRLLIHLEDQGYIIDKSDKERFTFSTQAKQYKKNLSAQMVINGQVRGNRIYLSGIIHSRGLYGMTSESQAVDKGMPGSPMKEAFDSLDHTAGLFTDSERLYLLR
jgi:hypothetical protein